MLHGGPSHNAQRADSARVKRTGGARQEDSTRRLIRTPSFPIPFPAGAGAALSDHQRVPLSGPEIDSLARIHPELRAFLLREFLIPTRPLPDFTPPGDRERFAAYVREQIPGSRFERMSEIARGHAEAFDVPLHPSAADYLVDIVATIHWLLGSAP